HTIVWFSALPTTSSVPPCAKVIVLFPPPLPPPPACRKYVTTKVAAPISTTLATASPNTQTTDDVFRAGGTNTVGPYDGRAARAVPSASSRSNSRIRCSGSSDFISQIVPHRLLVAPDRLRIGP